jgi:hypothetical protein
MLSHQNQYYYDAKGRKKMSLVTYLCYTAVFAICIFYLLNLNQLRAYTSLAESLYYYRNDILTHFLLHKTYTGERSKEKRRKWRGKYYQTALVYVLTVLCEKNCQNIIFHNTNNVSTKISPYSKGNMFPNEHNKIKTEITYKASSV